MNIVWTERAKKELLSVVTYINDEFGIKSVATFQDSIKKSLNKISANPLVAPKESLLSEKNKEYRSSIVGKYNKIVYFVDNDTIVIADIWDMRRDPNRLSNRIK